MVAIGQMYSSPDWKVLSAIEVGTQRLHSTDLSDFEGQEGPYIDLPGRFGELHLSISSACGSKKDYGRPWPPGETMEEPCVKRVPGMDLWSLGVSYGTWGRWCFRFRRGELLALWFQALDGPGQLRCEGGRYQQRPGDLQNSGFAKWFWCAMVPSGYVKIAIENHHVQ